MGIFNFNINNAAVELLPPDKRYTKNVALIRALLSPLQFARDLFFDYYYAGNTVANYSAGVYNYLDKVVYNKKIYVSLIYGNTTEPTSSDWYLAQDNFIGIKERVKYCGSKIVLEYAINKQFGTVFRQPSIPVVKSDIYIESSDFIINTFMVSDTEEFSTSVGDTASGKNIGNNTPFVYNTNFAVYVPTSVFNAAGGTDSERENTFRNFIDKYIPISLLYTIVKI